MGKDLLLDTYPKNTRRCRWGDCPAVKVVEIEIKDSSVETGSRSVLKATCMVNNSSMEVGASCVVGDKNFTEYFRKKADNQITG